MIRIAVVTTPYEVQFYVSSGGNFYLVDCVSRNSFQKKRAFTELLTRSYSSLGFDVQVKFITATDKLRENVRDTLKKVIMGKAGVPELETARQEYINRVCEVAFDETKHNA